jgi:hypothetical protein
VATVPRVLTIFPFSMARPEELVADTKRELTSTACAALATRAPMGTAGGSR